jgi:hypothetical protein
MPERNLVGLEGRYTISVLNWDLQEVDVLENFDSLTYTRTINGRDNHTWGSYRMEMPSTDLETEISLDFILSVNRREPVNGTWRVDFEGVHRDYELWLDTQDIQRYSSTGHDLRGHLKRRQIYPLVGDVFYDLVPDYTGNLMRELFRSQCINSGYRTMYRFVDTANDNLGLFFPNDLHYRFEPLADRLEDFSDLGLDFDIVRSGQFLQFMIYDPRYGYDRRAGVADGTGGINPCIFSLEHMNMGEPKFARSRMQEATSIYVLGPGVGAAQMGLEVVRTSGALTDSPWNRIEAIMEASQVNGLHDLEVNGMGYLTDHADEVAFTFTALPSEQTMYGVDWDLGDLVTTYYGGTRFDMRIIEVSVTIDSNGETITPTMLWLRQGWDNPQLF